LRPGAEGRHATERVAMAVEGGRIARMTDMDTGEEMAAAALEPEEITGIYEGEWRQRRAIHVRDVAMALVAERRYSKMQILEAYLNEIYLGQRGARGIFGVAEAARFYFGKDPRDLSLAESALIAGLIRAPNAYSPFQSPERALERRNTVLRLLVEAGEVS